jgi:2-polyprenyl-3-methyl-5-hydroxy-6-metoxy-1,4-benzoquinol methylase
MTAKNNPSPDTGFETLTAIAKAKAFNKWMFKTIQPFCRGNILEIGSGIGNISECFIETGYNITLSDVENFYVQKLKDRFPQTHVLCIDLEQPEFFSRYNDLVKQYDTVFLLNVIEHINRDELAIQNCSALLKDAGTLIILTPAYPSLYAKLDKELHHFRRYTQHSLKNKVLKNGFTIEKKFHFNSLGIAGWLYAKLFRLKKIPGGEMRVYNKLVWIAKFLDKLFFNKIGLSIIVIAQKNSGQFNQ